MLEKGSIYKHANNIDVAFSPISVKESEWGLHLVGFWFNVGIVPKVMINKDNIFIRNSDLKDWKLWSQNW